MQVVLRSGREFQDLETVLQNLDFGSNFNAKIIELRDIPAGDFSFPHGLNSKPSGRIVLQQVGGGYITETNTPHDDVNLYLNNSGATTIASIKLLILR